MPEYLTTADTNIEFDYDEIIQQIKKINEIHKKLENQFIDKIIEHYTHLNKESAKHLYNWYNMLPEEEFKKHAPILIENEKYNPYQPIFNNRNDFIISTKTIEQIKIIID